MRRLAEVVSIFIISRAKLEMEFRVNFWLEAINALLALAAGVVVLYAFFTQSSSIGGWSFNQALILLGVFMVAENFIEGVLYANLNRIPELVRSGSLDLVLVRPIDSQILLSVHSTNLWSFLTGVLGIGVIVYGAVASGSLSLLKLLGFSLAMLAGLVILYSVWLMLVTTAFWLIKVDNVGELFQAFFTAGRFPLGVYPQWLRVTLIAVVPVALIVTIPAGVLGGALPLVMVLANMTVAALLLALSRWLWQRGLRRYGSASS